jgi:hypothetical protein
MAGGMISITVQNSHGVAKLEYRQLVKITALMKTQAEPSQERW